MARSSELRRKLLTNSSIGRARWRLCQAGLVILICASIAVQRQQVRTRDDRLVVASELLMRVCPYSTSSKDMCRPGPSTPLLGRWNKFPVFSRLCARRDGPQRDHPFPLGRRQNNSDDRTKRSCFGCVPTLQLREDCARLREHQRPFAPGTSPTSACTHRSGWMKWRGQLNGHPRKTLGFETPA
jgi:hypothetical protein